MNVADDIVDVASTAQPSGAPEGTPDNEREREHRHTITIGSAERPPPPAGLDLGLNLNGGADTLPWRGAVNSSRARVGDHE